ncbi:MAG: hypothetical protein AB7U75_17400 [Hyphomicrobiaceae bacterium]
MERAAIRTFKLEALNVGFWDGPAAHIRPTPGGQPVQNRGKSRLIVATGSFAVATATTLAITLVGHFCAA